MQTAISSIPIIDFQPFWQGDTATQQSIAIQIDRACREIGFFYLRNYGTPAGLLAQQFEQSRQFFALPLTAKQQLAWKTAASNCGYGALGREQLDPACPSDYKETFNINRELESSLVEQRHWPKQLPEFRSTAIDFFAACVQTADAVLQAIALALKLPPDFFTLCHSQQVHTLRLLHYPPLPSDPSTEYLRAAAHTDYGSITLLFQDAIAGLEVQTVSGDWIAAPPVANTVLVNLGDLMQRWTNANIDRRAIAYCPQRRHSIAIRSRFSVSPTPTLKLSACQTVAIALLATPQSLLETIYCSGYRPLINKLCDRKLHIGRWL
jgi:isopenicillin N synthase-like dioxygenase